MKSRRMLKCFFLFFLFFGCMFRALVVGDLEHVW